MPFNDMESIHIRPVQGRKQSVFSCKLQTLARRTLPKFRKNSRGERRESRLGNA
jgi:hypothetical protein